MEPKALISLLGRCHTDPAVENALVTYKVRNRPEVEIDEDDADGPVVETHCWVKNSRAGIEFGFDDEAAWIGLDETEFGKRPMLLTQIYLYGRHDGVRPYQNPLPLGLSLSDDKATVCKKLYRFEATRHSHVTDAWDTPEFRLVVAYADQDSCIGFVLCALREPPLPPLGYSLQPVPLVDTLVGLLGRTLDDPAIRLALEAFGLRGRIDEIEETAETDFLRPFGFSLDFTWPEGLAHPRPRSIALSGITFFHEREQDARTWPGDLPLGIQFGDSPETVERKIGRPPDEHDDEEFSGHAVWHEAKVSIHLTYDTMQNRALRVAVYLRDHDVGEQ